MPKEQWIWPLYFAAMPLKAKRVTLKKGQMFPQQSKPYIRGLGSAYGVSDAETRAFHELPYVKVLNVGTEEAAKQVIERGLDFDGAKKLTEQGATT
jgi:hypothetical protein